MHGCMQQAAVRAPEQKGGYVLPPQPNPSQRTQNCVLSSHVAASSTNASRPCPRFCTARKWRHPNVRSMAVHLLPVGRTGQGGE